LVGDLQLNEWEVFSCLVWFYVLAGVEGELIFGLIEQDIKITFRLFARI
jgi:hypothetical protein